jgi:hypothetical protein
MHVKAWPGQIRDYNGLAADGAFNFYDVGLDELRKIVKRFPKVVVQTFGKWEHPDYAKEKGKAEVIINGHGLKLK